jgi:DMSO/TMAO reductase YedYZ heme-binding membrane subunit
MRYIAQALALIWAGWWTFFGLACGLSEGMSPAREFCFTLHFSTILFVLLTMALPPLAASFLFLASWPKSKTIAP